MFAVNDSVTVADLDTDTAVLSNGMPVATLINPGVVIEASEYPPGVTDPDPESPSPHYLVRLVDGAGSAFDLWVCGPRVSAA